MFVDFTMHGATNRNGWMVVWISDNGDWVWQGTSANHARGYHNKSGMFVHKQISY